VVAVVLSEWTLSFLTTAQLAICPMRAATRQAIL
jgi:hypothetical protein